MGKLNRTARGLTFAFGTVLVLGTACSSILEANRDAVDSYLKTQSSKLVQKEGGKLFEAFTPDSEYLTKDGKGDSKKIVKSHEDLAKLIQAEGTVLLKNKDNTLPVATSSTNKTKVSLFGARSSATITGAFIGHKAAGNNQTIHFDEAFEEAGFEVNPVLNSAYESYVKAKRFSENDFPAMGMYAGFAGMKDGWHSNEASVDDLNGINADAITSIDNYNDLGVVVLGRAASEGIDWDKREGKCLASEGITNPMQITAKEKAIIKLAEEKCKKVVVIINAVNQMELQGLEDDPKVGAVLWMGIGANYAPRAVVDIISGATNPSGHLSDIYATSSLSAPAMVNYGDYKYTNADACKGRSKGTGQKYVIEAEGIYTGYRYYETRYADFIANVGNARSAAGSSFDGSNWEYGKEVTYGFGYGLSYTTFTQEIVGKPTLSHDAHDFTFTFDVKVTNTGKVAGKDVVQIYGQAPYTADNIKNGVEKSAIQLVAFDKTEILEPGKSQTLSVKVDMQNLASWDSKAKDGNGSYILDAGNYYFSIGNGAHEALNNVLAAQGVKADAENKMTADGDKTKVYTHKYVTKNGKADEDTFNVSKSGQKVKNSIQYADPNYFKEDSVKYLSRNDWNGTWPLEYKEFTAEEEMIKLINGGTYTVKTDDDVKDLTFGKEGKESYINLKGAKYTDPSWDNVLDQLDYDEAVAFIVHGNRDYLPMESVGFVGGKFTENGPNGVGDRSFKTLSFNNYGDTRPAWAIDETDENAKFQMTVFPSGPVMGSTFNPRLAYAQGRMMGNDALFVGLPILWGPSMNTHRTGYNGRNLEYYSEDPVITGVMGMEYSIGALDKGLIAAPKHFAFNDQETNRSGVSPYLTEQRGREIELRAFQLAFEATKYDTVDRDAGLLGVMTSFSKIGPVEVTCSRGLLTDILRGEWGYKGYIVSDLEDDVDYLPQALYAGVTSWDSTMELAKLNDAKYNNFTTDSIKNDREISSKVKEAVHCDLWVLTQSNYMNMVDANTQYVEVETWWRTTYKAVIATSASLAGLAFVATIFTAFLDKKKGLN